VFPKRPREKVRVPFGVHEHRWQTGPPFLRQARLTSVSQGFVLFPTFLVARVSFSAPASIVGRWVARGLTIFPVSHTVVSFLERGQTLFLAFFSSPMRFTIRLRVEVKI